MGRHQIFLSAGCTRPLGGVGWVNRYRKGAGMDRVEMAKEIVAEFATLTTMDRRDKIGAIGLALMALEVQPTESQWRDYLLMAGINFYEADALVDCIEATCLFYYSNLLNIVELEEDSWVRSSHEQAFRGVTDEEYAANVERLRNEASVLRDAIRESC